MLLTALRSSVVTKGTWVLKIKKKTTHTHAHHKIQTKMHFNVTENRNLQVIKVFSLSFWLGTDVC